MLLCGLTEPVRIAFNLAGLLSQFTEVPSRDEALAAFASRPVPPRR